MSFLFRLYSRISFKLSRDLSSRPLFLIAVFDSHSFRRQRYTPMIRGSCEAVEDHVQEICRGEYCFISNAHDVTSFVPRPGDYSINDQLQINGNRTDTLKTITEKNG
ncbi:hypothetical protein ANN_25912 [Periplaneta americana]|uniref:Uncharacterized protein n=1 Tax=Periplaneta americana TaxID=6978 RepID=A0ABQ8S4X4_PERAM|nr:hypothetical protein ANN_25912 [Periplaneta americana]